jgi:hypothetical protein
MGPEIALISTVASGVMGVVGSIQQGQAQAAQADYTAQVARNNAQIAQQNAEYAAQAGEASAQAQDMKARAALSSMRAAQSASGLSLDSPSLQDIYGGSEQVFALDRANIVQNAALRARSYQTQGASYEAEAGLQERRGSDVRTAGYMGAAGSLLSGASSFAAKWDKFYPRDPRTSTYT